MFPGGKKLPLSSSQSSFLLTRKILPSYSLCLATCCQHFYYPIRGNWGTILISHRRWFNFHDNARGRAVARCLGTEISIWKQCTRPSPTFGFLWVERRWQEAGAPAESTHLSPQVEAEHTLRMAQGFWNLKAHPPSVTHLQQDHTT